MTKFIRNVVLVGACAAPALVYGWPWSQDMMNQPSIKPQEGTPAPFAARSVPVSGIPTTVANRDEAKGMKNPMQASPDVLKKGKNLFRIICSACHGLTGKADSPVSDKIGAIDLTSEYVQKQLTEGWIWGTITFGSAIMPAYGKIGDGGGSNDLSPEERWYVVTYVKNQLAKDAAASAGQAKSQP